MPPSYKAQAQECNYNQTSRRNNHQDYISDRRGSHRGQPPAAEALSPHPYRQARIPTVSAEPLSESASGKR